MGSEQHPLRNVGIYRNLPIFDATITGLKAIVTGADGISGFHTMRVLLESPKRWSEVYALSRKAPPKPMMDLLTDDQRSRVQHVAVDFLESPETIVKAMTDAGVSADYVFFYSYLQPKPPPDAPSSHAWSNAEELASVNKELFGNFLEALQEANVKPKRLLLQTGAKNYGVQYDLLSEYCKANNVGWNVLMPAWIVGAVSTAQINGLHPFAVNAAVQAHREEPLRFPSDFTVWQDERKHATARLMGYLSEWAVLEDKCKDQKFNAQDTAPLSWDRFFHELARWYGVSKGVIGPEEDEYKFQSIVSKSGKDTSLGYGPPTVHKASFSLVDWAKQPENRKAWEEIMAKSKGQVTFNPFDDPEENFQMGDGCLMNIATLNMNKARRMGWTGYVNTIESIFEMYQENAILCLVPEMVVGEVHPLV